MTRRGPKVRYVRVVMISPYVPFPGIDHAGGAYLHAYLAEAAKSRQVDLFAPASLANRRGAAEHGTTARIHLVDVRGTPSSRIITRWWNVRNFARGLTPGWQVLRAFRESDELRRAVEAGDLLEIHWDYMLPILDSLPTEGLSTLAFPHDVVAQVFERRAVVAGRRTRAVLRNLARRISSQEVLYLNRTQGVFVFSKKDADLLIDAGLSAPVHLLDPLVDVPAEAAPLTGSTTLIFVAAMHRPENVDGIRWFLRECWPGVLNQVPEARLVIAGSDPPPGLTDGVPGASVTGWVEDFDDLYRVARGSVVPLRAGAGLKFKVVQAMAWGLPVVTTPVGAEGIVDLAGAETFAVVSSYPADLVGGCVRILTDERTARQIGHRGRDWVASTYDSLVSIRKAIGMGDDLVSARQP